MFIFMPILCYLAPVWASFTFNLVFPSCQQSSSALFSLWAITVLLLRSILDRQVSLQDPLISTLVFVHSSKHYLLLLLSLEQFLYLEHATLQSSLTGVDFVFALAVNFHVLHPYVKYGSRLEFKIFFFILIAMLLLNISFRLQYFFNVCGTHLSIVICQCHIFDKVIFQPYVNTILAR